MRLLVDLMGAQTKGSRIRGIGRYTRELALALALDRRDGIDLRFALSGNFPDVADELRALLSPYVPAEAFSTYVTPVAPRLSSPQSDPARRAGEAIVRRHVAGIAPDCLLASSLYEVAPEDFSYFDLRRQPAPLASCILYDLIPLRMPKQYLRYADYRKVYEEQTAVVASADLLFAISEHSRRDAIELLNIDADRIVTIGGAADASFAPRERTADESAGILKRLGLREKFILCAAGVDPRKNATTALDAFLSMPREDRQEAQFVLLAPLGDEERAKLQSRISRAGCVPDDVKFISRVNDDDLAFLYARAEVFLFPSLYEGFGLPVLEAMQCGGMVIAGNNSSIPEIANRPDVLCDMSSATEIAGALAKALREPAWRADVRAWGLARSKDFSWAWTAQLLQDGLLDRAALARTRPHRETPACFGLYETAETEIADILRAAPALTPAGIAPLLLRSAPQLYDGRSRRLLVDVTTIATSDRRTGIQRVVRNIVRSLHLADQSGVTPVAVRLADGCLRTCQGFVVDLLGCPNTVPDADVELAAGDCLLMLDNSWGTFADFFPVFDALQAAGGTVVTCVYDLIPELHLAASVDPVPAVYAAWLRAALARSDGIVTISKAVMDDLLAFLARARPPCRENLRVGWFQCGSDIAADAQGAGKAVRPDFSRAFEGAPVFLVVGTVEPRKGQGVALDAFDQLWAKGSDARLVVIGSRGWHVDALLDRMRNRPAWGSKLFWFADAGDAELAYAYSHCAALLNPSYAEGFGLPLAEAARADRPVICSDIPVFREVGRDGALYFRVNDPAALAGTIGDFLAGLRSADPGRVLQTTWAEAARRIVEVTMRDGWSWRSPGSRQGDRPE